MKKRIISVILSIVMLTLCSVNITASEMVVDTCPSCGSDNIFIDCLYSGYQNCTRTYIGVCSEGCKMYSLSSEHIIDCRDCSFYIEGTHPCAILHEMDGEFWEIISTCEYSGY